MRLPNRIDICSLVELGQFLCQAQKRLNDFPVKRVSTGEIEAKHRAIRFCSEKSINNKACLFHLVSESQQTAFREEIHGRLRWSGSVKFRPETFRQPRP